MRVGLRTVVELRGKPTAFRAKRPFTCLCVSGALWEAVMNSGWEEGQVGRERGREGGKEESEY